MLAPGANERKQGWPVSARRDLRTAGFAVMIAACGRRVAAAVSVNEAPNLSSGSPHVTYRSQVVVSRGAGGTGEQSGLPSQTHVTRTASDTATPGAGGGNSAASNALIRRHGVPVADVPVVDVPVVDVPVADVPVGVVPVGVVPVVDVPVAVVPETELTVTRPISSSCRRCRV